MEEVTPPLIRPESRLGFGVGLCHDPSVLERDQFIMGVLSLREGRVTFV